jgi:signal transduction histidine kinase
MASGQDADEEDEEPSHHRLVLDGATLQFLEPINTTRIVEVNESPTDNRCGTDLITVRPDGTGFTFDESFEAGSGGTVTPLPAGQTGCAEAQYDMAFPAAASVRVRFETDRRIEDPAGQEAPATQEFRLHLPDGERREELFDPEERTVATPRLYDRVFALPAGTTNITLGWFFHDTGLNQAIGNVEADPGAQAFSANVFNISIEVRGMQVPLDPMDPATPEVEEGTVGRAELWLNFSAPPAVFASMREPLMFLDLRAGPKVVDLQGPDGALDVALIEQNQTRDRLRLTFGPDLLRQQGGGDYSLRFVSERVLPVDPVVKPTRIQPFFYTMLLLPAPAAVLALYSGLAYRREAEGRYRRAATAVLALIIVAIVYYALLVVYAVYGAGERTMTTLPLQPEATLVYVQLLVLLLFFVVSAVVVGRYLQRAMRRDIETRRLQEEKLRRSNEELERFAYVASHDLQEPLRKVAGFTSLLQRRYKGRLDKDADEMIQYAVDGATRMQALIRDILAYSRVGSSELDLKPVEVGTVLELVVSDLGEKIKEEKAQVDWQDLPTVEADAGQLRQVLQNLVENGVKYRHPSRRPRIRVSAERDGAMWRFAVADNGVGIPADKLTDIFGIFRRLHGAEVPGTGIGLALAKKAVERHGGRIWVESREGKGSTFYFTLPAQETADGRKLSWRTATEGLRGPQGTDASPA